MPFGRDQHGVVLRRGCAAAAAAARAARRRRARPQVCNRHAPARRANKLYAAKVPVPVPQRRRSACRRTRPAARRLALPARCARPGAQRIAIPGIPCGR